jgi:hypothetical protein
MVWQHQNQDQLTSAKLSQATTGLGVAGTHGPEGKAAFSCGRPVNRHADRSRRPKEAGGGACPAKSTVQANLTLLPIRRALIRLELTPFYVW